MSIIFIFINVFYCSYPENDKDALVRKVKLIIADNGQDKKIVSLFQF